MKDKNKFEVLGVWLGFDHPLPIKREGVGRFILYLLKSLLKNYPIRCELWCYSFNYAEVQDIFSSVEQEGISRERIKIITEADFKDIGLSRWALFKSAFNDITDILFYAKGIRWNQPFNSYKISYGPHTITIPNDYRKSLSFFHQICLLPVDTLTLMFLFAGGFIAKGIRKILLKQLQLPYKKRKNKRDPLALLATKASQADCFLIPIVTLYNSIEINKPKFYSIHDLAPLAYAQEFIDDYAISESWMEEFQQQLKAVAAQGSFLCSNSDYVRKNHTLKYIENVSDEHTGFVYLPTNIPEHIHSKVITREETIEKYHVKMAYLFYPTQIRPYKNVLTLLKAIKILRDKQVELQLLLTGRIKYASKEKLFIRENHLDDSVLFTGDVPEVDLYSLHRHAAATVVPTLFEGGFPWQGLEALLMDTPVIMSKIPVTVERLKNDGFAPENCGLKLFDPLDEHGLAVIIDDVLKDRKKAVIDQANVKDKLLSYTWDDASRQYYRIFEQIVNEK